MVNYSHSELFLHSHFKAEYGLCVYLISPQTFQIKASLEAICILLITINNFPCQQGMGHFALH